VFQANLPTFRIVPLQSLILHEEHDSQRASPLVEKLRQQGILRNPPIVLPLSDGSDRHIVLDGANRVTALKLMEFPHILVQLAVQPETEINLRTWKHVIWGMSQRVLLAGIRNVKGLQLAKINPHSSMEAPRSAPVQIRMADGSTYLGIPPRSISGQVRVLREIVNVYKQRATMDRTSQTMIEPFRRIHPKLTALLIFPRFEIQTILELAAKGEVLPPGITRFTVSPRALHLNYPLHELSSGKPLAYKVEYLDQWIESKVAKKGIRFYAEATFLFDE
jgi:hypothetical protein